MDESVTEIKTTSNLQYVFIPESGHSVRFRVKTSNDAHVALTNGPFNRSPITEIYIGGWQNTKSAIKRDHSKPYKVTAPTDDILDQDTFVSFWIHWYGHNVKVGLEGQPAFLQYLDADPHPITHIAVRSGHGAKADWQIKVSPLLFRSLKVKPIDTGKLRWVKKTFNNKLPPDALIGGHENGETLYIGRATRGACLIVGKYVPSKNSVICGWCRILTEHPICEILCGYNGSWLKTSGDSIPPHAFEGGYEGGKPYFVGRARVDGNLIPGKVLPPHRLCYLPFADTEIDMPSYEILVCPDKLPSRTNLIWRNRTNLNGDDDDENDYSDED